MADRSGSCDVWRSAQEGASRLDRPLCTLPPQSAEPRIAASPPSDTMLACRWIAAASPAAAEGRRLAGAAMPASSRSRACRLCQEVTSALRSEPQELRRSVSMSWPVLHRARPLVRACPPSRLPGRPSPSW